MNKQSVERVIQKFGSQQRVAELLGIWQTAVSGWVRRGAIPARRQQELLRVAAEHGIALSPADFFAEIPVLATVSANSNDHGRPLPAVRPTAAPVFRNEGIAPVMTAANVVSLKGDSNGADATSTRPTKDLYEIGEIPPLGHVPKNMYAWTIRKERHGDPLTSMQQEVVPVPELDSHDVLVMVMAAGVNYNGVWAALGTPVSVLDFHKQPYHIAGSDTTGIVWAVGSKVTRCKVGDEVVVHCNQDDGDDEECNGGDPMLSPSQRIWGYETPVGAFAQFTVVQARQVMKRPAHLTWEESGCYVLVLATAYRMLFGHPPHELKPGDNVLVWGGAGGLGSMAIQLIAASGANAIAVISEEEKRDFVLSLGAKAALNRKDFDCWGQLPDIDDVEGYKAYLKKVQQFGKAIWQITGKGKDVDMVFEHPGESTFPVSAYVAKRGGMVVICAGTTGYNLTFDARFMWYRQKRLQGSHFANLKQATAANQFVVNRQLDPCMSEVFSWNDIPRAHRLMWKNEHKPGNMAVLVQAKRPGLRSLEDAIDA